MSWILTLVWIAMLMAFNIYMADAIVQVKRDLQVIRRAVLGTTSTTTPASNNDVDKKDVSDGMVTNSIAESGVAVPLEMKDPIDTARTAAPVTNNTPTQSRQNDDDYDGYEDDDDDTDDDD